MAKNRKRRTIVQFLAEAAILVVITGFCILDLIRGRRAR